MCWVPGTSSRCRGIDGQTAALSSKGPPCTCCQRSEAHTTKGACSFCRLTQCGFLLVTCWGCCFLPPWCLSTSLPSPQREAGELSCLRGELPSPTPCCAVKNPATATASPCCVLSATCVTQTHRHIHSRIPLSRLFAALSVIVIPGWAAPAAPSRGSLSKPHQQFAQCVPNQELTLQEAPTTSSTPCTQPRLCHESALESHSQLL